MHDAKASFSGLQYVTVPPPNLQFPMSQMSKNMKYKYMYTGHPQSSSVKKSVPCTWCKWCFVSSSRQRHPVEDRRYSSIVTMCSLNHLKQNIGGLSTCANGTTTATNTPAMALLCRGMYGCIRHIINSESSGKREIKSVKWSFNNPVFVTVLRHKGGTFHLLERNHV